MAYNPKDHFFHKAKKDGFVARSAYKLQDLQKKYKLLRSGDRVLDLGCSPGSWSQVTLKIIGPSGHLLGIDLKPVEIQKTANSEFIQADILTLDPEHFGALYDCVISDMAPNTTGIRLRDQAMSEELCRMVLTITEKYLKPGGHMTMKIFEGPDADKIVKQAKQMFKKVHRVKPEAVRKGSFEAFIVGISKI
ncbi:MAG: SAM-dependent methyltransferase [Bdellovibrionales bacterium]